LTCYRQHAYACIPVVDKAVSSVRKTILSYRIVSYKMHLVCVCVGVGVCVFSKVVIASPK